VGWGWVGGVGGGAQAGGSAVAHSERLEPVEIGLARDISPKSRRQSSESYAIHHPSHAVPSHTIDIIRIMLHIIGEGPHITSHMPYVT
jgi:hypothetical protein